MPSNEKVIDDAKYYIGIDIGLSGGITILKNSKILSYTAMPIGVDGGVDIPKFFAILHKFKDKDCHVIFEKLHGLPNQKLSVIWGLGKQVGYTEMAVTLLKIPYTPVPPQTWQKLMFAGTTMQEKKSKDKWVRDTKKTALLAVTKLFPKEKFLATKRSRTPHDGIVDSVLLAVYGERKRL